MTEMKNCRSGNLQPAGAPLELAVPTATLILHTPEDPWRVLLGTSLKHVKPVLPGGKIDQDDLVSAQMEICARRCAEREAAEELGCSVQDLSFLCALSDTGSDVRRVPAAVLRDTLVGGLLAGWRDETVVLARYGVPDYLFTGTVQPEALKAGSELTGYIWVDVRTLPDDALSAGHQRHLELYRRRLMPGEQISR